MSDRARIEVKKSTYSAPTMSIYGGVGKLTASGTSGSENPGSMAMEKA